MLKSCFDTLRGGSDVACAIRQASPIVARHRSPARDGTENTDDCRAPSSGRTRILRRAAAGADPLGQADRHVDRHDRRLLRRGQHIGKARHDPHARLAALRTDEGRDPSAGAAVDPGKPCVLIRSRIVRHAGTAFATPLRYVISGGDP